jgi:hypothetical protein
MRPTMITTTPIMIPSIFDTIITPFGKFYSQWKLSNHWVEVKANFNPKNRY